MSSLQQHLSKQQGITEFVPHSKKNQDLFIGSNGIAPGPSHPPGFSAESVGIGFSAAPPPGFHDSDLDRQKHQRFDGVSTNSYHQENGNGTSIKPGSISDDNNGGTAVTGEERSPSFMNLAAVLGEGLATSIDSSFRESGIFANKQDQPHLPSNQSNASFPAAKPHDQPNSNNLMIPSQFDRQSTPSNGIDNFQRQNRHSSSRLIGKIPNSNEVSPFANATTLPNATQHYQAGGLPEQIHHSDNDMPTDHRSIVSAPSELADQPPRYLSSSYILEQAYDRDCGVSRLSSAASSIYNDSYADTDDKSFASSLGSEYSENDSAVLKAVALLERELEAEEELSLFTRDVTQSVSRASCRGLVIFGVGTLFTICGEAITVQDIRSTCEEFGTLETFRGDFAPSRGVIFASYFDLRSAQYAAIELEGCLNSLAESEGVTSKSALNIKVMYCSPLNSSSMMDESIIVLSNLPDFIDEDSLTQTMETYGAVKAVQFQQSSAQDDCEGISYMVEYYDVQDAKQALLELESGVNPWNSLDVRMETGIRNPSMRRKGREMLAVIAKWRQENSYVPASDHNRVRPRTPAKPKGMKQRAVSPGFDFSPSFHGQGGLNISSHSNRSHSSNRSQGSRSHTSNRSSRSHNSSRSHKSAQSMPTSGGSSKMKSKPQPQLVVTPDGQYSYVVINNQQGQQLPQDYASSQQHAFVTVPQQQYSVPGATHHVLMSQQAYPISVPVTAPIGSILVNNNSDNISVASSGAASFGNNSHRSRNRRKHEVVDESNLTLDIARVKRGIDKRTSLMVRNIPNKYTQKMLLEEFTSEGYASPKKIDFFYLPIDFKNKCNRGYAFINFTNYTDIIGFYHRYNGKSWQNFNSDKICDITYARIQGKCALVKRFEHSALLEKDDEYRPLVFVSYGMNKGEREEFPAHPNAPDGH